MTKIAESRSFSQRHGSAYPDPYQNVMGDCACTATGSGEGRSARQSWGFSKWPHSHLAELNNRKKMIIVLTAMNNPQTANKLLLLTAMNYMRTANKWLVIQLYSNTAGNRT